MFDWLLAMTRCRAAVIDDGDVVHEYRPATFQRLVRHLPELGNVLYVHARDTEPCLDSVTGGIVCDTALQPLRRMRWLRHSLRITAEGPYEWCDCVADDGRILGRFHLLPDTDFGAWDRMLGQVNSRVPTGTIEALPTVCALCASVVRFTRKYQAGMAMIGVREPERPLAPLSLHVAERLARSEALCLS